MQKQNAILKVEHDVKQCAHIFHIKGRSLSQPHFEGSVRSPLTLPKMGLGNVMPIHTASYMTIGYGHAHHGF
jgi:hypothetical protein